ncbi:MAG: glycosyltransferase family 4 protein [Bacteroidales bacterium]|nr:glycosyltransferase family 4 protein [Bacteroidales bacterium]
MNIDVSPLFDDEYIDNLYSNKSVLISAIKGYIKRVFVLRKVRKYDKIFVEKELFPYCPAVVEKILALIGIKYIVDYDDAIFHHYDMNSNWLIRFLLKEKINKVMKYSQVVIAGNNYLASKAKKTGAKRIEIMPTIIDLSRYSIKKIEEKKPVIIGWIGSQNTLTYLMTIKSALQQIMYEYDVELHIIGADATLELGDKEKHIKWIEETEVQSLLDCDIGIMPLLDTPWEQGKCGYKLIQYMACGLPVIASAIGANNDIVKHEQNGFLVNSPEEWINAFEQYITDATLRAVHGEYGRNIVENKYCIDRQLNNYMTILSS